MGEVRKLFALEAAGKNISFTSSIDQTTTIYLGDPLRLKQILCNLVGNAIKFTNRGFVKIEASTCVRDGKSLQIKVSDTGIGIGEDKINLVFESFEQADNSISRIHGGTGLGLAIVDKLTRLMGGTVEVTSELGKGSCFTLTLPFKPLNIGMGLLDKDGNVYSEKLVRRALVVDDELLNLRVMAKVFALISEKVDTAEGGESALENFVTNDYDLVILDIKMSGIDGLEAAAKMREIEVKLNKRKSFIVGISAKVFNVNREQCLNAGMDEYMSKPLDFDLLKSMIDEKIKNDK